MKIKYNLLYEENAELRSQVDILHKQLKENRKLVEKYRALKDKKQDDSDIPTDLVCTMYIFSNYRILQIL